MKTVTGWLLDSGCTDHMSFQRGDFKELDLFSGGEVLGAGGEGLKIAGKGEVELKLSGGAGRCAEGSSSVNNGLRIEELLIDFII